MNYDDVLNELVVLASTQLTDNRFIQMLPRVFDYAEQRCYRELNLLSTVTADHSVAFTANLRSMALPATPHFVTVQNVNVITPASQINPELGARIPLIQVSKEFLNFVWNSATGAGVPAQYAMLTDQQIIVGPWPDQAYTVEIVGTIRPTPLSKDNPTTFLTLYLPDLFTAACMIFISGQQRNFGAQSEDPRMSSSWEDQYGKLFGSANAEEMRKRWTMMNWPAMASKAP